MPRQRAPNCPGGAGDSTIISPTVVDGVKPDMEIFRNETFAPVVCRPRAKRYDQAVELANDRDTASPPRCSAQDINRRWMSPNASKSGICHINGATVFDEGQMPFGGVKASAMAGSVARRVSMLSPIAVDHDRDPSQHYPF